MSKVINAKNTYLHVFRLMIKKTDTHINVVLYTTIVFPY